LRGPSIYANLNHVAGNGSESACISPGPFTLIRGVIMLRWALLFFIVAIISAVLGFAGIAGEAAWIGKVLLVVFLILAVVSVVLGRRGTSVG
jgi:uncharacterized membrane protein YtjA (UPF0391 family)